MEFEVLFLSALFYTSTATLYDRRRTSVVSAGWSLGEEKRDIHLHSASLLFLHCIILTFCFHLWIEYQQNQDTLPAQ